MAFLQGTTVGAAVAAGALGHTALLPPLLIVTIAALIASPVDRYPEDTSDA